MERNLYVNPLITRYSSKEMAVNFGDNSKYTLWRKLWVALAEAEMEMGLNVKNEQVDELKMYQNDVNFDVASQYERKLRHEVMSHVHAYGEQAKNAFSIIHLGATSNFVIDNAEIILIDNALEIIKEKLCNVMDKLSKFALKYKDLPTLGFTHFQPAQLTTVGKRATLYLQDLKMDYDNLVQLQKNIKLRGLKGTTGTQASFLELFEGDGEKVKKLEEKVVEKMGYKTVYGVTGQTYPRKFDYAVVSVLSMICQSAYKFANDIRLLQSMKEIEEPFEKSQIGSSAMAYKRNPMRSERICSLSRYVMSLPIDLANTASNQWFERTLDDSANKRIVIPEAFMATDGVLNIYMNVCENLVVYENVIKKNVERELPFMATENILMECVKKGGNRQLLHEKIRVLSMQAGERVKKDGLDNNLLSLIEQDDDFIAIKGKLKEIVDPVKFVGRAPMQTVEYIEREIYPVLEENKNLLGKEGVVKL